MENNKFFITVNRINSIIFLLILIGGFILTTMGFFSVNEWDRKRSVEVTNSEGNLEKVEEDYRLGTLEEFTGHDVQYVTLNSKEPDRSFSSGYGGASQVRNVLFFKGENLEYNWLYKEHTNLILCVCKLRAENEYSNKEKVVGLYINAVKKDTNGDGLLSNKDRSTIALLNIDGTGYKEVEQNIDQIIDTDVTNDGKHLIFMVQVGNQVIVKKYSLASLTKLSERVITDISKPT